MKALRWIGDYWLAILLGVVAIVGVGVFVATGGKSKLLLAFAERELDTIGAKRDARNLQAELGAAEATAKVKAKYVEKRKQLDAEAEAKIEELDDDPVALAAFLERVSR